MKIGDRIKQRRKELEMSVDQLAEKLGKYRSTVYRYENGDIENLPLDVLEPVAEALQTTPQYLMGWQESPEDDENPWELELLETFHDMKLDDQIYFTDLAKYFSIRPDEVKIIIAQKVGKSSPTTEGDETARELYEIIGSLDSESRQKALDYLKYLSDTSKK